MAMRGMTEKEIAEKYGTGKYGIVAICQVVTGERVAKFTIVPTKGYKAEKFANGETSIKVNLADLPKTPKLKPNVKEPQLFRIKTNTDEDGVDSITPARGHFMAKLVDLGPRVDKGEGDPMPKEKVFKEGTADEERHFEFFAVYEVIDGIYKGVKLPAYWMHYKFMDDGEGNTKYAYNLDNPKAARGHQLREWMILHGLEKDEIPWDDETILPTLLKRALKNNMAVEVNIKDGYILKEGGVVLADYQGEFESDDEDDLDEVDEEFHVKEESVPVKEVVKTLAKPTVKKIKKKIEEDLDAEL